MPEYSEIIDNPRSDRLRRLSDLKQGKHRRKYDRFLIEGPQSVREAVLHRPEVILDIYIELDSQSAERAAMAEPVATIRRQALDRAPQAYLHYVSERAMKAVSSDAQGILALGKLSAMQASPEQVLDQLACSKPGLNTLPALWQVRDPGNEGTIIRSADAAGCPGLLLVDECVDPYNPKTIRSTAGSLFHIPVAAVDTPDLLALCQRSQLPVVAADIYGTDQKQPLSLLDFAQARAAQIGTGDQQTGQVVLFGNEARGLPQALLTQVDQIVSIPIFGKAESLNLATSAAVLLFTLAMSSRLGRM